MEPNPDPYQKTNSGVLLLNAYFEPIHITNVRKAFILIFTGRALPIDISYTTYSFEQWLNVSVNGNPQEYIQTPNLKIKIPRVVLLHGYKGMWKARIKLNRQNIFLRDEYTCQYCGKKFPPSRLNLDHIIPKHLGGKTTWENLVCCCIACNLRKGGKPMEEARMRLSILPTIPKLKPFLAQYPKSQILEEWLPFCKSVGN